MVIFFSISSNNFDFQINKINTFKNKPILNNILVNFFLFQFFFIYFNYPTNNKLKILITKLHLLNANNILQILNLNDVQ